MLAEIFLPPADVTGGSAASEFANSGSLSEVESVSDWLAYSGDYVHKGQVLGHAEIAGAVMDIVAPASGVLHILVPVDRPMPALSLVGMIDTAPDARSFTVTFTPAGPPSVEPAAPAASPPEWTVSLATPARTWPADTLAASGAGGASQADVSAPPAAPEQVLPPAPKPSPESTFPVRADAEVKGVPRPPAARLPLLSRRMAAASASPEAMVAPPGQPAPPAALPAESPAEPSAPADSPAPPTSSPGPETPEWTSPPVVAPPIIASIPSPRARLYASPRARILARQRGVDVTSLQGSGPFGRVEEEDVWKYLDAEAAHGAPAALPHEGEPASLTADASVIIIDAIAIISQPSEPPAPVPVLPPCEPVPAEPLEGVAAPASAELESPEPAAAEPVAAEHVVPEHVVPEPIVPEPAVPEPVAAEPVVSEPVVPEPVSPEPVAAEPVSLEPTVPEPVAAEPVGLEPTVPEPVAAEPPEAQSSFASPHPLLGHAPVPGQTATLTVQVDASELLLMRDHLSAGIQKRTGAPLALSVVLAKLVALALRDHPALNARQTDQGFQIMPNLELALATETLPGHVAPVVTGAGSRDLLSLSREALSQARFVDTDTDNGSPANARPATFTIVTVGNGDVDICTPALPFPQCAALGVGCIAPRPVVLRGQIGIRPTVFLSLAYHATAISAAEAAGFLTQLRAMVEDPAPLAEGLIC